MLGKATRRDGGGGEARRPRPKDQGRNMTETTLAFTPTHDEAARQAFVGSLKTYANMDLQKKLADLFDEEIAPSYERKHGRAPAKREDVSDAVEALPLYKYWGLVTYHSQDMLFGFADETVQRTKTRQEAIAKTLAASPHKKGALVLKPGVTPSRPISDIEIHRQPGGYTSASDPDDLTAARLYAGTIEIYSKAKGMRENSKAGSDAIGQFLAGLYKRDFPAATPSRILDMGCGTGDQTLAYARAFPDAEIHGLDASAPFVRYAHALAESQGKAVTFHHLNAQETDFPDGHFDAIFSHILFHETSHKVLPQIMAEAYRLLAPGGVFLNLDVPYQPAVTPLIRQITNHWQVRHNGEPFWTGFATMDLKEKLIDAGFEDARVIHRYEPFADARYLAFGGVK